MCIAFLFSKHQLQLEKCLERVVSGYSVGFLSKGSNSFSNGVWPVGVASHRQSKVNPGFLYVLKQNEIYIYVYIQTNLNIKK